MTQRASLRGHRPSASARHGAPPTPEGAVRPAAQALALRMLGSPSGAPLTPAHLLAGQAALGNQAVQRFLHLQREDGHGHGCTCAGCARSDAAEAAQPEAQREDGHGHGCTCAGCAR